LWLRVSLLAALVLTVGASVPLLLTPAQAEVTAPRPTDRQVTIAVTSLMRRLHVTRHALDDEISGRWLEHFIESLDPGKLYFYASDIKEFDERKLDLDNQANRGDISFAHQVFRRYLRRVDEKQAMAEWALEQEHDFSIDETIIRDPENAQWSASVEEARERWRKRIKHDLLVLKGDGTEEKEAIDRLQRRYRGFARRMHQTSDDELLEIYLTSMTTSYDPHSTYMSPETQANFEMVMRLSLQGIGASLRYEDGYTIVTEIVPGGAADKDGRLKPEDRVIGVAQGDDGAMEDVVEMKLSDVVNRIRGNAGTKVRLQVIPAGKTEPTIIDIVRAEIELADQEARGEVIEAGKKPNGNPYKLGVINMPSFYRDLAAEYNGDEEFRSLTRDVRKLIEDPQTGFKAKGVDAILIDLRANGGGSLTEVVSLVGLFVETGPVVQIKDWEGKITAPGNESDEVVWGGPLVVMTSKASASASEIFAAAIQDYQRGLVVGDQTTHGKGSVQSLLPIGRTLMPGPNPPELGSLKVTTQQYYRINGEGCQLRGVQPDVILPSIINHLVDGEADLDHALPFDKVPTADFRRYGQMTDAVRNQLQALSAQRIEQQPDWQRIQKQIALLVDRKDRETVTLNADQFAAERAAIEALQDEEEKDKKPSLYNRPVIERNYYFDEVVQISLDYLRLAHLAQN
jgi:carboxyl-terminal processing protease